MRKFGNIRAVTRAYEQWMRASISVRESQLRAKHAQMKADPFLFFRGTYYRWAQVWPTICKDLAHAPRILAIGDLHVGSFGTWRDAEGRCAGASMISTRHTGCRIRTIWFGWPRV